MSPAEVLRRAAAHIESKYPVLVSQYELDSTLLGTGADRDVRLSARRALKAELPKHRYWARREVLSALRAVADRLEAADVSG